MVEFFSQRQKFITRGKTLLWWCLYGTHLKRFSAFLGGFFFVFEFTGLVHASSYTPGYIEGKYQFGIIDYDFYHAHDNACGGWMPKLADYYGGRDNPEAILGVRRSIVPGCMVDPNGDLFTLSLHLCDDCGPRFQVARFWYENQQIEEVKATFNPFWDAYGDRWPQVGYEPYFDGGPNDEVFFKNCFHNAFQCCIMEELEADGFSSSDHIVLFNYIPTVHYIGSHYTSRPDFEGALFFKRWKNNVGNVGFYKDDRGYDNCLSFSRTLVNYGRYNIKGFSNNVRHYQGFLLNSHPDPYWLIHAHTPDDTYAARDWVDMNWTGQYDENAGVHCHWYDYYFSRNGVGDVKPLYGAGVNSSLNILKRFFKIGSYVYFATTGGGYWLALHAINPDNKDILRNVIVTITDVFPETTMRGGSCSHYSLDFCILEPDGTPSTHDSPDGPKILCVFSLGGAGAYARCIAENDNSWDSTYLNWPFDWSVGLIGSVYFSNTGSEEDYSTACSQNVIYVTGYSRASETFVDILDSTKSDLYRLYLNSHKMVPYTSPSGRHYLIYAYCYPGQDEQLYLGYARYIIDADHKVKLLTQSRFKDPGGGTFGDFQHCSRIISMDLKNGHLWITFMKDTGIDASHGTDEEKIAAGCYRYFHILVSDLIQE